MLNRDDILNFLKEHKLLFSDKFNITKIGIFGSYARNEQTDISDIDIIIDMSPGTEAIFEKRLSLQEMISKHFSKPVDICHLRAIKPVFREMILKDIIYV